MEKKSAQILNLSRFFFPSRGKRDAVAPDHDAPSRVLNRLGFAAFVLDFPDVCRKKDKRRHGGGAKAQKRECRFLRERDALVDTRHCVFGAAFVSLIFSKIGRRDGFSDPPTRCAREKEKERESKEKERRRDDDDDDPIVVVFCGGRARHQNSWTRTAKGPQHSRKGKRKDPRERERERE